MEKEKSASILGIVLVVLIAAGLAWAGSQNSLWAFGMPLFALCIGLAFVIQWLVFIPAYFFRTEKYFDLTGSLTYITVILAAMIFSESVDTRSYFLAGMVVIWAVRLGSFLFGRILKSGKDSRFDTIKLDFLRFLQTWTLQGLWISFTLAAALAAITSQMKVSMDGSALAGILIWAAGISIEAVADRQKSEFRKDPGNEGKFIQTGLWSWSRHPNYFGEIVLWVGVAIVALPVLYGWRLLTLVSPLFVFLLLTRVSGVPMLEKRADGKWGGQADYDAYKARTSILIPLPPRKQ